MDTREKLPLWDSNQFKVKVQKLDEGDYTTEELFNKAHAERKSGIDLYGSLIQGHKRFSAEIQRAIEKDLDFAIFVECTKKDFIAKKFHGGYRLKVGAKILRKVIDTMNDRYPIQFIWCEDREDLKERMLLWFVQKKAKIMEEIENGEITKN